MLKKAKQSWKDNFDKVLSISESKEFAKVRKYYDDQYRQAIDGFLKMNKTTGFDNLFRVADIADIYSQIYVNIGVKFAKWYAKNFDKVVSKQTDVSGYTDIWAERFNSVSQQIAAERVTLVSGTAKATLVKVFKRLSSDPEFMVMNEREASRILRQKFGQYSKSQAERLVRTEATNAANFATLQSATDMFGQENLQKEWMTALDGRERPAHRTADGQIVDFKERFTVGGELLFNPGDPAGSAKNVINCRCSTAPFPKPDAQAAGTIEGFGVRPPVSIPGTKPPKPPTGSVLRTPKPVREPVREVIDDLPDVKTVKEAKEVAKKIFKDSGINISTITMSSAMDMKTVNKYVKQIHKLTKKYKINHSENLKYPVTLRFKSTKSFYGVVTRSQNMTEYFAGEGFSLRKINLGDKTDLIENRTRFKSIDSAKKTFKSSVDIKNSKIATLTHEFAHIISDSKSVIHKEFWNELKQIKRNYADDLKRYIDNENYKAFNDIYLGQYASTNMDEFLAEGFAEYELSSKPSKYARLIGEKVNQYFKK